MDGDRLPPDAGPLRPDSAAAGPTQRHSPGLAEGGQRRRRPVELPAAGAVALPKPDSEPGKPGPNRPGHGMPGPPPGLEHGPPGAVLRLPEEAFSPGIGKRLGGSFPASGQKTWPDHVQCVLRRTGGLPTLPPAEGWFCLLTQQLNLFRIQDSAEGPMVSLMHQRFRDCLGSHPPPEPVPQPDPRRAPAGDLADLH